MEKERVIQWIIEQLKKGVKISDRVFPFAYTSTMGYYYKISLMYSEPLTDCQIQRQFILVLRNGNLKRCEQPTSFTICSINQHTSSGVEKSFCKNLDDKRLTLTPPDAASQIIDNYNAITPGVIMTLE